MKQLSLPGISPTPTARDIRALVSHRLIGFEQRPKADGSGAQPNESPDSSGTKGVSEL